MSIGVPDFTTLPARLVSRGMERSWYAEGSRLVAETIWTSPLAASTSINTAALHSRSEAVPSIICV